ncbi:MAG: redoxin domain-containing protein [Vicinamibacteria bacterium]|jgi:cytochrome c biogenesis protein CcmG/thiol:disulfide interchange protein DsbE|nr:redoxin domain-containing protein [Vicinamibacteria bacterium]
MKINIRVLIVGLIVILPLVFIFVANLQRDPSRLDSPLIGREAPLFSLRAAGGAQRISIEKLRGRPLVVNFWATWCGPCMQEHAVLLAGARRAQDRARFIGILYQDQEDAAREYMRAYGSAYPTLLDPDGRTAIAYGVYGVPETYFIDARGILRVKHVGPLSQALLDDFLARISQGAP